MSFLDTPEDERSYPAVLLERRYGIEGISADYIFPHGHTGASYQTEKFPFTRECVSLTRQYNWKASVIDTFCIEKIRPLWDELKQLNPELEKVKFDQNNGMLCYHAVLGVASRFHINDIQYFLTRQKQQAPPVFYDADYKNWVVEVRDVCFSFSERHDVQWIPSPETRVRILDAFKSLMSFNTQKKYRP